MKEALKPIATIAATVAIVCALIAGSYAIGTATRTKITIVVNRDSGGIHMSEQAEEASEDAGATPAEKPKAKAKTKEKQARTKPPAL